MTLDAFYVRKSHQIQESISEKTKITMNGLKSKGFNASQHSLVRSFILEHPARKQDKASVLSL